MMLKEFFVMAALSGAVLASAPVQAQTVMSSPGAEIVIPAYATVSLPNNEATVLFVAMEEDKDKAAAASRVNDKMKRATAIVRQMDPGARLQTAGYDTYEVYSEELRHPDGSLKKAQVRTGWRVSQDLRVVTGNFAELEKMVAATQQVVSLTDIKFGLTREAATALDERQIAATYRNLNERMASMARAMGRKLEDAMVVSVDLASKDNQALEAVYVTGSRLRTAPRSVVQPSFEPGHTTLKMSLIGKVKFK